MKRIEHDYYPTPPDVVEALRRQLPTEWLSAEWVDPAAGAGTLFEWLGVPRHRRHAIELRRDAEAELSTRVDFDRMHVGVDALMVHWPSGVNIVANPPFRQLDRFVRRIVSEVSASTDPKLAAVLMPTQWLQAQRRADILTPTFFWPLRWRPSFRAEGGGAAHDVAWAVWISNDNLTVASASWLPRPTVPQGHLYTYRRLLGMPVSRKLEL